MLKLTPENPPVLTGPGGDYDRPYWPTRRLATWETFRFLLIAFLTLIALTVAIEHDMDFLFGFLVGSIVIGAVLWRNA
jgi:hypothetical protein